MESQRGESPYTNDYPRELREANIVSVKIDSLITFIHEYAHAFFEEVVDFPELRRGHVSAYNVMTEGYGNFRIKACKDVTVGLDQLDL